jgi:ATP-dependent Lon protease
VIAPKLNEPDLDEFPEHLLDDIEFAFVDQVDQVLKEALEPEAERPRRPTPVRRAPRERAAARQR